MNGAPTRRGDKGHRQYDKGDDCRGIKLFEGRKLQRNVWNLQAGRLKYPDGIEAATNNAGQEGDDKDRIE